MTRGAAEELRAPVSVAMRWCPECDRMDRWAKLSDRHWWAGVICSGEPVTLTYRLVNGDQPTPTEPAYGRAAEGCDAVWATGGEDE